MGNVLGKCIKLITGIMAIAICVIPATIYVKADENMKIRVGFYEMAGFQEIDENGNYTGYNVEYLSIIAKRGQWQIEYVPVEDFTDGLEALKNKEIDLLAPSKMVEERADEYLYSNYSFGTDYYVLITGADNDEAVFEDYEYISTMKVAVVKDYPLTEDFVSYMKNNNITSELVYYDSVEETLEALENGEVDGAATSLMMVDDNYKVLAKYASSPFYYLTWDENEDMMYKIDEMMHYIQTIYPQITGDLEEKYYPIYSEQQFTATELDFISKRDVLKVAYMDDYSPVSFANLKGELEGISRVIFDEIQEITGFEFEYVKLPKGDITYEFLIENEIDLVTGVTYNSANVNSKKMVLSIPYFWSSKVFVGEDIVDFDKNASKTVAVISGSQTIEKVINEAYPNFKIVRYDTVEECFDKVKKGDVDYLFINQFVANNMLIKPEYREMEVVPVEGLADELCFSAVVVSDTDNAYTDAERMMMIQIIDKAISIIGQEKLNEYAVEETMNHKYSYSLRDYLYMYRYLVAALIVVFILMVAMVVYFLKHRIERRKRNIEEAVRRRVQQRRYEAVLNNSGVIIYEISLKDNTIIVSDRFKEKFGRSIPEKVDELTPELTAEIFRIHPDDKAKMFDTYYFEKGCSQGDNEVLIRIANKMGEYIWCNVTRVPIFNNEDEIVSVVGKIVDVDEQMKERWYLEEQARTDGLSGLLNKRAFREEVEKYLNEHSSYFSAMIFVDMDKFKEINDRFGHNIGDTAIKDISEKLGLIFSNIDFVSRFGGDEFCVFVKNIPQPTLTDKMEWALEKLRATYESERGTVNVTASIGVAYCKCNDATYEVLLKAADEAVYEVKNKGRNGYVIKDLV